MRLRRSGRRTSGLRDRLSTGQSAGTRNCCQCSEVRCGCLFLSLLLLLGLLVLHLLDGKSLKGLATLNRLLVRLVISLDSLA